jgi:hypothetical protein
MYIYFNNVTWRISESKRQEVAEEKLYPCLRKRHTIKMYGGVVL